MPLCCPQKAPREGLTIAAEKLISIADRRWSKGMPATNFETSENPSPRSERISTRHDRLFFWDAGGVSENDTPRKGERHSVVPTNPDGDDVNRGNRVDTRVADIRMVDMGRMRRAENRTVAHILEGRIPIRSRYSTGAATTGQRMAEGNNPSFHKIPRRLTFPRS